jgi:hypothetical protein
VPLKSEPVKIEACWHLGLQQDFGKICRDLEGFTGLSQWAAQDRSWHKNILPIGDYIMGRHENVKVKESTKIKDALDHAREAAQELHGRISDAMAKRGGATKPEIETISQKAKAAVESIKASLSTQHEATKKHLTGAVTDLEAAQKNAADGLKSSGQAFETKIRQALADARTGVDKITEAIAAKRAAQSKKTQR